MQALGIEADWLSYVTDATLEPPVTDVSRHQSVCGIGYRPGLGHREKGWQFNQPEVLQRLVYCGNLVFQATIAGAQSRQVLADRSNPPVAAQVYASDIGLAQTAHPIWVTAKDPRTQVATLSRSRLTE